MVRLVVQAIGEALFADRTASQMMVEWTPPSKIGTFGTRLAPQFLVGSTPLGSLLTAG